MGLPQMEPVRSAKKVKVIPMGALTFEKISASLMRQTRKTTEAMVIPIKIASERIAQGTCTYIIR